MNSQAGSEGPISAPSGRVNSAPLIGNVGQEYVQITLSTNDPVTAINDIQVRAALSDPQCKPLLGLLDQLGLTRAESHKYIVQRAVDVLLDKIPTLPAERLLSLLEETFPYITIPDLRSVPLAVLARLRPVPATFLKQLAADQEIFWELPLGVQRQAWELDRKLLRTHALSLVAQYIYETATWVQTLNMEEVAPPEEAAAGSGKDFSDSENGNSRQEEEDKNTHGGCDVQQEGGGGPTSKLPQLARRNLRNGSAALRQLVAMVGSSLTVYRGIVDVCTARFREADEMPYVGMKDAALCALRSQLLMALHDAGETGITSADPCYKLAWTLDVCVKDGYFFPKRIKELRIFFASFVTAARIRRSSTKKRRSSGGARRGVGSGGRGGDDDAESAGVPGAAAAFEDPLRELGTAGMILRDPTIFHQMLYEVVRRLERCVAEQAVPKDDPDLAFLTQLLTLAVSVRGMLRDGEYDFPEADIDVIITLYPLVADLILDAELMDEDDEGEVAPPPEDMVFLMVKDEIGRRVVQTYALKRLAAGDLKTGQRVLLAIERCLGCMSTLAIPEFAPFAFTLARRMVSLLSEGKATPSSPLWSVAVDGVLLRLVDSETEAHEEILRLLLAAAPLLEPATLGRYLSTTLANSRRSRKAHVQRAAEDDGLPPSGYFSPEAQAGWGPGAGGMYSHLYGEDFDEDGYSYGGLGGEGGCRKGRGADGVRGTYALFLGKKPELDEATAPELLRYLEETARDEDEQG